MLSQSELNKLDGISRQAGEECSKMFTKWLKENVVMNFEKVECVPFSEIAGEYATLSDKGQLVSVGLYLELKEGIPGHLVFLFSEASAKHLCEKLTKRKLEVDGPEVFDGLSRSALLETANILACAYLNSLGTQLGTKSFPGPPMFIHDLTQSIVESVLNLQATQQEEALAAEVDFKVEGKALSWGFLFLPNLKVLKEKL